MSLRLRLFLALAPLVALLAALGVVGFIQLKQMGNRIDAILRENYESVQAMYRLNEAIERIDSSFQFALAGKEKDARRQFADNWQGFDEQFQVEAGNITIHPAEDQLVAQLDKLRAGYRDRGARFYAHPAGAKERADDYFGRPGDSGLLGQFEEIKQTANQILLLNQHNMEAARDEARATARSAAIGFGICLMIVVGLVAGAGWYLLRTILTPIHALTEVAHAIGMSHQLDREVPVFGRDELGQLAEAFNAMTRQLRQYRLMGLSKLMRAQWTAQATIDSFPDPVLVLDPGGRVELANPAAQQVLGVSPGASPDSPVWQPPEALRASVRDALQAQRMSSADSFDQAVVYRLGGEDRAYLPQVRPIRTADGDTLGAAVVLADVTRFRLLDQLKSDLAATVSHELKTPLTSVRLALHVLLEETVGPLTPKQTELLVDARDSAERLLGLIEQLLALARLQRPGGTDQRHPIAPSELLHKAADAVHGRAEDRHVALEVHADAPVPLVAVDAERIGLALGNLLDNAIAYTPSGGRVVLSAGLAADGRVELTVQDTGVGIPAEYLPRVFERFFRVPGQSNPTGTGLGLAIVKEIVIAHGGEVICESKPKEGTTFRLMLPACPDSLGAT